ncbi:MAG: thioredoxin family protein [Promethearchaeota archaeon]
MEDVDDELIRIREKKAHLLKKAAVEVEPAFPSGVVHVRDAKHFSDIVSQYHDTLILVDCSAVWCGPCKMFEPIYNKLQQEFGDRVVFLKLDVDEVPELANYFRISGVPTTLFLAGRKLIYQKVGLGRYDEMKGVIQAALKKIKQDE